MLIGIRFARFHDPNVMVGKCQMSSEHVDLWHVATHAIGFGDRAGFCPVGRQHRHPMHRRRVAGEAFRIVEGRFSDNLLMRVVTCDAANARVRRVEALTVGEPVWLEADGRLALPATPYYQFPGPVTLSTKVGDMSGR